MSVELLQPGDKVFHPRAGLGVVSDITTRDMGGQSTKYYEIKLVAGGTLSVPLGRAEDLGLRRAVNSLGAIAAVLYTPPAVLPQDARRRMAELNERARGAGAGALAEAVRDLLGFCRGRPLTAGERKWLDGACEQISTEVALVDDMSVARARVAVYNAIEYARKATSSHDGR